MRKQILGCFDLYETAKVKFTYVQINMKQILNNNIINVFFFLVLYDDQGYNFQIMMYLTPWRLSLY